LLLSRVASEYPNEMAGARILVVDDSEISRELVRLVLEAHGHEVRGLETAEALDEAIEHHRPDLVLLDVSLPGAQGDQALRKAAGRARCPVVLFSDRETAELAELARTSGASGFLRKTGDPEVLIAVVEAHLLNRNMQ
jgi:DNA-binding response OmpR family regulator